MRLIIIDGYASNPGRYTQVPGGYGSVSAGYKTTSRYRATLAAKNRQFRNRSTIRQRWPKLAKIGLARIAKLERTRVDMLEG